MKVIAIVVLVVLVASLVTLYAMGLATPATALAITVAMARRVVTFARADAICSMLRMPR